MRLPFLQMESDLIAHGAAEVAHLAGCPVALALGHVAMLRAWAVSAANEAPPDGWVAGEAAGRRIEAAAQWTGAHGRLLQALLDAGQVRSEDGGIRVLHLEPYVKAWEQNRTSKERMRKLRERAPNTDERPAKFDGQTQTQTQTEDHSPATAGAAQGSLGIVLEPKAARRSRPRKDGTPPDPRHAPLVKALTDAGFPFLGGRDAKNVTALLAIADQQPDTRGELAHAEILRRARLGWAQRPGFHSAGSLSALVAKWGDLERPANGGAAPEPNGGAGRPESAECAGCGEMGAGGAVGEPKVWLCYGCGCLSAFSEALDRQEVNYREAASWAEERRHAR
jgi:hypothetical protein